MKPTNSKASNAERKKSAPSAKPNVELPVISSKASDASTSEKPTPNAQLTRIEFKIDEVVWAKIKGHPHWPAKVKAFANKMVIVTWFNDYRTTKIYRTQLFKFLINYDEFSKKFGSTVGLEKAAHEALIYFGASLNKPF